jgi:hypothetical protein
VGSDNKINNAPTNAKDPQIINRWPLFI